MYVLLDCIYSNKGLLKKCTDNGLCSIQVVIEAALCCDSHPYKDRPNEDKLIEIPITLF